MTLEDLGNIGDFLGAIGVIVSLAYVAVEIRRNTKSVRASTYQEIVRDMSASSDLLASDRERLYGWGGAALCATPLLSQGSSHGGQDLGTCSTTASASTWNAS